MTEHSTATRARPSPAHEPAREQARSDSNGRTVKISTRYGKLTPAQVKRAVESVAIDKQ